MNLYKYKSLYFFSYNTSPIGEPVDFIFPFKRIIVCDDKNYCFISHEELRDLIKSKGIVCVKAFVLPDTIIIAAHKPSHTEFIAG